MNDCNIKSVVATYKRQDYALTILKYFGFDKYIDIIHGADHENKLEKKDIIKNALMDVGITDFSDAVMVGDSDNDAIGAEKIGISFIGVTYGFGFSSKIDVCHYRNIGVAESTQQIVDIILGGL